MALLYAPLQSQNGLQSVRIDNDRLEQIVLRAVKAMQLAGRKKFNP